MANSHTRVLNSTLEIGRPYFVWNEYFNLKCHILTTMFGCYSLTKQINKHVGIDDINMYFYIFKLFSNVILRTTGVGIRGRKQSIHNNYEPKTLTVSSLGDKLI